VAVLPGGLVRLTLAEPVVHEEVYLPEGVRFQLALPEGDREAFLKALQDATRGRAVEG
jgi:hypothetical protein